VSARPAESPDGSTKGHEQDLPFQTFVISSKMLDMRGWDQERDK